MIDLIERLTESADHGERCGWITYARLSRQAADEIERLRAENARLQTELNAYKQDYGAIIGQQNGKITQLEAENARLKEALATCWELREYDAKDKARLREALKGLVSRLDVVHADPAYGSVWTLHQIHCGPYRGPTYTEALENARRELEGKGE